MTAEIVIMNTRGVALASDSAVTIGRDERKVYYSANKMFELSNQHPVGVMIYGVESLFNVPWETLIKVYRNQLNNRRFDTLKEYVKAFIDFLNDNEYDAFMAEVNEADYIYYAMKTEVNRLYNYLSNLSMKLYGEYGELHLQDEIQTLYFERGTTYLKETFQRLKEKSYISVFDDEDFQYLMDHIEKEIERYIGEKFESHLFYPEWLEEMKLIVIHRILKMFTDAKTGIVFTGFGEREIYPSTISLYIEGKINGKLKYSLIRRRTKQIDHSLKSTILPFAQSEMVHSFISGIHQDIEGYSLFVIRDEMERLTDRLMHILRPSLKDDKVLRMVERQLEKETLNVYQTFDKYLFHYQKEHFIDPMMDIVSSLPVEELAHMAESFLNIASFKMKMSPNLETVGGPIDVAVITKGDGFQWVKRK